jgi:hypothetical protein
MLTPRDENAERRGQPKLADSPRHEPGTTVAPFGSTRTPTRYWPAGVALLTAVTVFAVQFVIESPSPRTYGEIHIEEAGKRTGVALYSDVCRPLDAAEGVELSATKNGRFSLRIQHDALGRARATITLSEDSRSFQLTPSTCRTLRFDLDPNANGRSSEQGLRGSLYVDCPLPDARDVRGGATFEYCR